MIGPHEGRELELMLAGEKPAAMFCDYIPDDGNISEDIIPEKAFQDYVKTGTFIRTEKEFTNRLNDGKVRYVCFTQPSEQWRSDCILWLQQGAYDGTRPETKETPIFIGRLLGYSEEDIQDFMKKQDKSV